MRLAPKPIRNLVKMFNRGVLGNLLKRLSRGTIGHTPPARDAEFLVICPNEALSPNPDQVVNVVTTYYSNLGYVVDVRKHIMTVEINIFHKSREGIKFHAVISPRLHIEDKGNVGILVKSQILCAALA